MADTKVEDDAFAEEERKLMVRLKAIREKKKKTAAESAKAESDARGGDADNKPCKVFVGGVSFNTSEDGLAKFFEQFGPVVDSAIVINRETRRPKGFGFITFANKAAANKAILAENLKLDDRDISVRMATRHGTKKVDTAIPKIFVGGIKHDVSQEAMKEAFNTFGPVTEVRLMNGYAFVTFEDCAAANRAITASEVMCGDLQLNIQQATEEGSGSVKKSRPALMRPSGPYRGVVGGKYNQPAYNNQRQQGYGQQGGYGNGYGNNQQRNRFGNQQMQQQQQQQPQQQQQYQQGQVVMVNGVACMAQMVPISQYQQQQPMAQQAQLQMQQAAVTQQQVLQPAAAYGMQQVAQQQMTPQLGIGAIAGLPVTTMQPQLVYGNGAMAAVPQQQQLGVQQVGGGLTAAQQQQLLGLQQQQLLGQQQQQATAVAGNQFGAMYVQRQRNGSSGNPY